MRWLILILFGIMFCSCKHEKCLYRDKTVTVIKKDIDTSISIGWIKVSDSLIIPENVNNDTIITNEIIDTSNNTKLTVSYNVKQRKIIVKVEKPASIIHIQEHEIIKTEVKIDSTKIEKAVKPKKIEKLISKWELFLIGIGLLFIVNYLVKIFKKK